MFDELGKVGVWRGWSITTPEHAAAIEDLGYGALWLGGSPGGDLKMVEDLLDATTTLHVATGITNIWADEPASIATAYRRLEERHPGRFLLGLGTSHREAVGDTYVKPYEAMVHYLDLLDEEEIPVSRRLLAALGPRVLALAAERTAGAHPYLTTPAHTGRARELMGQYPLLAPEQKVVLELDPDRARAIARPTVATPYLKLQNYTNNLRTLGYTDADFADGGSDRLIDALVAWGDAAAIATRVTAHLDAGANHVAIQLLTEQGADPIPGWTTLAGTLLATG